MSVPPKVQFFNCLLHFYVLSHRIFAHPKRNSFLKEEDTDQEGDAYHDPR